MKYPRTGEGRKFQKKKSASAVQYTSTRHLLKRILTRINNEHCFWKSRSPGIDLFIRCVLSVDCLGGEYWRIFVLHFPSRYPLNDEETNEASSTNNHSILTTCSMVLNIAHAVPTFLGNMENVVS